MRTTEQVGDGVLTGRIREYYLYKYTVIRLKTVRAIARLSTEGGKGGAIEKFLILEKFAKILENFEQNFLNNFE